MDSASNIFPTAARLVRYCQDHPRKVILGSLAAFFLFAAAAFAGLVWLDRHCGLHGQPAWMIGGDIPD